jgi:hypothetical protein
MWFLSTPTTAAGHGWVVVEPLQKNRRLPFRLPLRRRHLRIQHKTAPATTIIDSSSSIIGGIIGSNRNESRRHGGGQGVRFLPAFLNVLLVPPAHRHWPWRAARVSQRR